MERLSTIIQKQLKAVGLAPSVRQWAASRMIDWLMIRTQTVFTVKLVPIKYYTMQCIHSNGCVSLVNVLGEVYEDYRYLQ
jgi:hypothetical protein